MRKNKNRDLHPASRGYEKEIHFIYPLFLGMFKNTQLKTCCM